MDLMGCNAASRVVEFLRGRSFVGLDDVDAGESGISNAEDIVKLD